jgi:hypothetical protein
LLEDVRGLVGLGSPLVLDVNPLYIRRGGEEEYHSKQTRIRRTPVHPVLPLSLSTVPQHTHNRNIPRIHVNMIL